MLPSTLPVIKITWKAHTFDTTLTSEEQNNVSACMDCNWKQASCTEKIMKRNLFLLIVVYSATHYPILTYIYWNNYYSQTGKTKEKPVYALITSASFFIFTSILRLHFPNHSRKNLLLELNIGVPCIVSRCIWLLSALPWVPEVFLAWGGNFRCWPKTEATSVEAAGKTCRAVHYKESTETGNRARKVSGTQSMSALTNSCFLLSTSLSLFWSFILRPSTARGKYSG